MSQIHIPTIAEVKALARTQGISHPWEKMWAVAPNGERQEMNLNDLVPPDDAPKGTLLELETGGTLHPNYKDIVFARRALTGEPLSSGPASFYELAHPLAELGRIKYWEQGNTPLLPPHPVVQKYTGIQSIWTKVLGDCRPSCSFKDYGMFWAILDALCRGSKGLICASTGNTAGALAAMGAMYGIPTFVLVPQGKVAPSKLIKSIYFGAHVVEVEGDFDDCMRMVTLLGKQFPELYVGNSSNPWRIRGQATIAWEILRDMNWEVPDAIVLPVGNAGNISAIGSGFIEAKKHGLIDRLPMMIGVQAERADPLVKYFETGVFEPVVAETAATAIKIGNPVSLYRAIAVVEATDGLVIRAPEFELARAQHMAGSAGISAEPASVNPFIGARALVRDGRLKPDMKVVCITTGGALNDTDFIGANADKNRQHSCPNEVGDVARVLETLMAA